MTPELMDEDKCLIVDKMTKVLSYLRRRLTGVCTDEELETMVINCRSSLL
jgi:hypothetical protein